MRNLLGRSVLEDTKRKLIVDLFFDKLSYNHIIDLHGRLEQDPLTITQIKTAIESSPKSLGWRMRARVGPKKKWYADVEELYAGH